MARASQPFETFTPQADVSGGFASEPFNDGASYRAMAQVMTGLGSTLGKIADKAAATAEFDRTVKEAEAAIGLPEVSFKLKPGALPPGARHVGGAGSGAANFGGAAGGGAGAGQDYYRRLAQIESGGNPNARNKDSGAAGLYQFIPSTAKRYGLANPYDPAQAQAAVERLTADNARYLRKVLGREPSAGELYLAHQQGAGGAAKLLRAGNASAASIVGERAVTLNGGHAGMTAAQFAGLWVNKFQGTAGAQIGGSVGASSSVPLPQQYVMQVTVPDPKPLALRHDGTITGEAHDKAIIETASWKMVAGLDAEIGAAYENNKDDPPAFQKAMKEVADKYTKQADALGPEVSLKIKDRAAGQMLTYGRAVAAENERVVEEARKSAAGAALQESTTGLAREAYLIGVNADGDARLTALSNQANASVDAALASGAITPAQAAKYREDFATDMVTSRIRGVYDALSDPAAKLDFVKGLDAQYADDTSPLAKLAPETFQKIRDGLAVDARQLADKASAASALDKFTMKRALVDDLASMKTTGQGGKIDGVPLDPAEVARVLGPDDAANWLEQRGMNRGLWEATSTMPVQTADQIATKLDSMEPQAGEPGFARKQAVYEAAQTEAKRILELRRADPATAAEEAYPQIAQEKDPKLRAVQRMDAQAALGIEGKARQPLTKAEAMQMAGRIDMVSDNPEALMPEFQAMMGEAQKAYGSLADEVMVQVMGQQGISRATAATGLALMQQMNLGEVPAPAHLQQYGDARRWDMGAQAMDGATPSPKMAPYQIPLYSQNVPLKPQAPLSSAAKAAGRAKAPTAASLAKLRNDPSLAPQFDQMFGQGTADKYLQHRDEPVRRKLPDGSVELSYSDGWVETLHTDGTIDGRQGP